MQQRKTQKRRKPIRSKSKQKRFKTFNSSQFSLVDLNNPSFTDLFKNQAIKLRQNNVFLSSGLNCSMLGPNESYFCTKKTKSQKNLQSTKRKTKIKKTTKNNSYQVVPYKNSLNSEIIFSNQETVRESQISQNQSIAIHFKEHLINQNLLRMSIKKQYHRKVQAAIKIQKVFRGYLTRKILQKYISQEHKLLSARIASYRSSQISEHSSYFNSKEPPQQSNVQNQEEQSEEEELTIYRHQQPIYSHDDISEYLKQSESEEESQEDTFNQNIIFQTNEQYIDSRKSSVQNKNQPKNKLSRPNIDPIVQQNVVIQEHKSSLSEEIQCSSLEKHPKEQEAMKVTEESESCQQNPLFLQTMSYRPLEQSAFIKKNKLQSFEKEAKVSQIKEMQKNKWEEMINLVSSEINKQKGAQDINNLMQQIMKISLKNKQSLQGSQYSSQRPNQEEQTHIFLGQQKNLFKFDQEAMSKIFERKKTQNQRLFFIDEFAQKTPTPKIKNEPSLQNSPKRMKNLLIDNLFDDKISSILKLRQQLFQKKYQKNTAKLQQSLHKNEITFQQFQYKMTAFLQKFQSQQLQIQKAKADITKGYKAAVTLVKEAYQDAHKLGYKLPASRSAESFKIKGPLLHIMVDEMSTRKPFADDKCDSSSSSFNEEDLGRFKKPYDFQQASEIANLNQHVIINHHFASEQSYVPIREIYSIDDSPPPQRDDFRVDFIVEKSVEAVLWEFAGELLMKPIFSQRLNHKNNQYKPQKIMREEMINFMQLLEEHLPSMEILHRKLNQKVCPLPEQLLKCMRIDFSSENQSQDSYEEVGKYQFIIDQQVCNEAIKEFKSTFEQAKPLQFFNDQSLREQCGLSDKLWRYIQQRQKFIANRKKHTQQLRWQVLNIQIHCIFDAWNEQLITILSQRTGFSGIGLNELTLAVKDYNSKIKFQETNKTLMDAKCKVVSILDRQFETITIQQDSKWIFYADEALSYGLQLGYLIEEQLFAECIKELKRLLHA